jgi:starch phosphorylase
MATWTTPDELRRELERLARDLRFSYLPELRRPFLVLDPNGFERTAGNPAAVLADLPAERLERATSDAALAAALRDAREALQREEGRARWWERRDAKPDGFLVAYFSAEFGLDESLPIYSGGLGVLAGDHLKSADELGVPLVGVGLFYRHGYFGQTIDEAGRQQERYPDLELERLPVTACADDGGRELRVSVGLAGPGGDLLEVVARVVRVQVGRVALYLLDADVDANPDWARGLTDQLYGGDREHRLHQELLLGVGGVRALRALGLTPSVFHLNEGHSAFLQLERLRELGGAGSSIEAALEELRRSTVFTTHTPVAAGNEVFDPALVARNLRRLLEETGLPLEGLLELGSSGGPGLDLTALALRTSGVANGVSALHGDVARGMWQDLWPDRERDAVPIGSVTNGVHARTWVAPELATSLRARGVRPEAGPGAEGWAAVTGLEDAELWHLHERQKHALLLVAAGRAGHATRLLPDALTIGFARRFATYKRADLLLSDPERLERLLEDVERPVQLLVAGKAHPADEGGKTLLRRMVEFARSPASRGRVVFLADYDLALARLLVSGVDVWLNTPRRPFEASGTSGMKAALNGVVNVSILDGWWAEAYDAAVGFAIGGAAVEADEAAQDARDAEALFTVLEQEVVPTFYDHGLGELPHRWIALMKASIPLAGERFTTARMVAEYTERYYLPAHRASTEARALAG